MIVIRKTDQHDYNGGPIPNLTFEKFSSNSNLTFLHGGGFYHIDIQELESLLKTKNSAFIELEQPNSFWSLSNPIYYYRALTRILTVCPYTADWLNRLSNNNKFRGIIFPINEEHKSKNLEKDIDVFYAGNLYCQDHVSMIDIITKFKYAHVNWDKNRESVNYPGITYTEKMDLLDRSKISVCYNLLYPTAGQINRIKNYDQWINNIAFSDIDSGEVPQYKPRVTEAMLKKSLVLIKKDKWNVIEKYYKPNEDFLYFEHTNELKDTINEILRNYDKYKQITENALKKTIENYTTERIYETCLKDME